MEENVVEFGINGLIVEFMCYLKCKGFVDVCLVKLVGVVESEVCKLCYKYGLYLVYKCVDICVVEFLIDIVYMYLIYEEECEFNLISECLKIMVLGGGLNCIG